MKQPINSETLAQSILEAELFDRILEADRGRDQFLLLEGLDLWAILALPMLNPAPPAKTWFFETEAEARAKFDKLTGEDPAPETAQAPPLTYKTDHFTAEQKNAAQANARHQEKAIEDYFKANPDLELGASEIWLRLFGGTYEGKGEAPLTSIRRALTNLRKKGVLRKLEATTIGFYDRQEHLWAAAAGRVE